MVDLSPVALTEGVYRIRLLKGKDLYRRIGAHTVCPTNTPGTLLRVYKTHPRVGKRIFGGMTFFISEGVKVEKSLFAAAHA